MTETALQVCRGRMDFYINDTRTTSYKEIKFDPYFTPNTKITSRYNHV